MTISTPKQVRQRELSWKLRMIMGARSNIYPRERSLSVHIQSHLNSIYIDLKAIEAMIRKELENL